MEGVYILSNYPSFNKKNLVKIGRIDNYNKLKQRLMTLNCSVPTSFKVVALFEVKDGHQAEKEIHQVLESYRVNKKREFFKLYPIQAARIMDEVLGQSGLRKKINIKI